jgi:hypothetical protein
LDICFALFQVEDSRLENILNFNARSIKYVVLKFGNTMVEVAIEINFFAVLRMFLAVSFILSCFLEYNCLSTDL